VASRGERGLLAGGEGGRAPSTTFWDYLASVSFALAVLGVAVLVWAMATGRGQDLSAHRRRGRLVAGFVVGGLIAGMVLGANLLDLDVPGLRGDEPGAIGEPGRPSQPRPPAAESEPYSPELRWLPVVLLVGTAAAAVVAFQIVERRRRRRLPAGERELADELAALLDDTLDDLRAEPDPRRAVIAAYARAERTLAGFGFARRPFEAPLEYLDRIAAPLHDLLPSARRLVFELTHLFERAKFSAHEVDAEMKEDAIRTLAALREELREAEAA
jgi:hypothetical protein